jgi:Phenazine biosynthesis-like protein
VRIFTPGSEIPFAGHPNVGTAFALAGILADRNERVPEQFFFEEEAGLVPVTLIQANGAVIGAELLAPEPLSRRGQVAPETAAACLSLTAEDIRTDRHRPQVFPVGLPSNWPRATRCAGRCQAVQATTRRMPSGLTPRLDASCLVALPFPRDLIERSTRGDGGNKENSGSTPCDAPA